MEFGTHFAQRQVLSKYVTSKYSINYITFFFYICVINQLNCFNLIFRRNSFIRHLIQDFVKGFFAIDLNFYLKDITMVQRSELHVMSEPWLASLTIIMSYIMSRLLFYHLYLSLSNLIPN